MKGKDLHDTATAAIAELNSQISPHVNGTQVSVVGSFLSAILPNEIELFIRAGICIDRRNNTPMEMDAYSVYLALKALERTGKSYEVERRRLVQAVVNRMSDCGDFWSHGAWTGSLSETHMRFTAAAIRLLTEAQTDGLDVPAALVVSALRRHLFFSEKLTLGTWFLHDSFEKPETAVPHPHKLVANKAFGSSAKNCMVLNTHVDTLVTIVHVLLRTKVDAAERSEFIAFIESGTAALRNVLRTADGFAWLAFTKIDSLVRAILFQTYESGSHINRLLRRIILRTYFPVRQRIRSQIPAFVFPDGYIERDVSLSGMGFEYHLVNLYDLSRFVVQSTWANFTKDKELVETCEKLIDDGLKYAICGKYWSYLVASAEKDTRSILLCEVIIGRLGRRCDQPVPKHWIKGYCHIRRMLPPTPALLGYDPVLVQTARPGGPFPDNTDVIILQNGRRLTIDFVRETFAIDGSELRVLDEFQKK
jgi:hypothetical protein